MNLLSASQLSLIPECELVQPDLCPAALTQRCNSTPAQLGEYRKWRLRGTYSVKLRSTGPLKGFLYLMYLERNRLQTNQLWLAVMGKKNTREDIFTMFTSKERLKLNIKKEKSPLWQSNWPVFCCLLSSMFKTFNTRTTTQKGRLSVYETVTLL